jgi:hypothetical protein
MAAKKTAKKMTKAAFVRSLPASTPAKEVVEKAKAASLTLTEGYVYNVRATSKAAKNRAAGGGKGARGADGKRSIGGSRARGSSVEELLRAVAAEIGLGRALEILQGERAKVRAVLGG